MVGKDRLKAGIIGLGVGERHIQGYLKHPECDVVALCDFSEEKLSMARDKYPGMRITKHAEGVLDDPEIDVVSIASYDNYHYEQVIRSIEKGKHIFVEKPMCMHEKEAIDIRSRLKEKPHLKLSSNLILRRAPRFRRLKDLIEKGLFGDIYSIESDYNYGRIHKIVSGWRGGLDFYSVVYGGGIHIVDLILWLIDEPVEEVYACGNNICTRDTRFEYNDFVSSLLKFPSGRIAKMACNFGCVFPHFHTLSLYGTKATFINGLDQGFIYESRDSGKPATIMNDAYPGAEKGDLINSFIDSILYNKTPEVTMDDIFNAMSICFAIEKSVDISGPVKVNYI